jgi:hypothetical protein
MTFTSLNAWFSAITGTPAPSVDRQVARELDDELVRRHAFAVPAVPAGSGRKVAPRGTIWPHPAIGPGVPILGIARETREIGGAPGRDRTCDIRLRRPNEPA